MDVAHGSFLGFVFLCLNRSGWGRLKVLYPTVLEQSCLSLCQWDIYSSNLTARYNTLRKRELSFDSWTFESQKDQNMTYTRQRGKIRTELIKSCPYNVAEIGNLDIRSNLRNRAKTCELKPCALDIESGFSFCILARTLGPP